MNIRDTRTLLDIINEDKLPEEVYKLKMYKSLNKKESLTDNWLETSRFEQKKEQIKDEK